MEIVFFLNTKFLVSLYTFPPPPGKGLSCLTVILAVKVGVEWPSYIWLQANSFKLGSR